MRSCSVECCEEKHYAKNYCSKHYSNYRRTGSPLPNVKVELHKLSYNREYQIWSDMKQRCFNIKNKYYKDYGGRGISVCDRWKVSFLSFYEDIGSRPSKDHSIDRIDNNGNYEPGNVKWSLIEAQIKNQRIRKDNKSGQKGVRYRSDRKKWESVITVNKKVYYIGVFDSLHEAIESRKKAEKKHWSL